jgi:rhamnosyltransferase
MVEALECQLKMIASEGANIGAIGPTFTDINADVVSKFQVSVPGRWFYRHETPSPDLPNIEALTLITSGLLIPIPVLEDVGLMREDFFIDHVDIEWSHRARSKGYSLWGTGQARMRHRMGESESLRVWYFGWRNESYYKPERLYYRFRNLVVLWRSDYIELGWKIRNSWYWLGFLYSHLFFGPNPLASLKIAARGVCDGLRGRMGRYRP